VSHLALFSRVEKHCVLLKSLATLTQEKAASEAKFLADKRRMRKEREELVAQINSLKFAEETAR